MVELLNSNNVLQKINELIEINKEKQNRSIGNEESSEQPVPKPESDANEASNENSKPAGDWKARISALGATGQFQPRRNTEECIQGIKRLRACSTNGLSYSTPEQEPEENSDE